MHSVKSRLLRNLAQTILRYPKIIVTASLGLALLSAVYTVKNIKLDTDQDNLISNKLPYHQRYKDFLKQFGDGEYFFVVFDAGEGKTIEAKKALLSLVDKIKSRPDLFPEIKYRLDREVFQNRAFLLLPQDEFSSLIKKVSSLSAEISRSGRLSNLAEFLNFVSDILDRPQAELKKNAPALKEGFSLFRPILQGIGRPEEMESLSQEELFQTVSGRKYHIDLDGFLLSPSGRLLFLEIMPRKDYSTINVVDEPLNFLRHEMEIVRKEFPRVSFGLTGRPVLQADEMASTGNDSFWASLVSILGVALLYIVYLRNLKRPTLIIFSLLCGMSWTIGIVTLTLGHLNLLTVVFAIILVGIGVDYGMHFLLRYLMEREKDNNIEEAITKTMAATGSGIITGGLATSAAFFSALFSDFLGLKELGFVAGTGVIFCLVSQLVTLPATLVLFDTRAVFKTSFKAPKIIALDFILKKPRIFFTVVSLLTLASLPFAMKLRFENNLLKLQDPSLESVATELKIIDDSGFSTWFAAILMKDKKKLEDLITRTESLASVGGVESIYSIIPKDQEERIRELKKLKRTLKLNPETVGQIKEMTPSAFLSALERLKLSLENLQGLAFEGGEVDAVSEIEALLNEIGRITKHMTENSARFWPLALKSQKKFFDLSKTSLKTFLVHLTPSPLRESDLPPSVKKKYVSPWGNYVLYVYPSEDIWQSSFMKQFIGDLRGVDPLVTGSPIGVFESAARMKKGFYLVGLLTSVLVILFLLLDFRSLRLAFIASLPLISGLLWLIVWMSLFHISLNLGNFFALPILIGLGIDNGVHLIHRFKETGNVGDMLHTVSPAIILSTLTTLIGFGALSFIHHRGLASFGQIMSLGSLTCLAAALLIVPLVLQLFYRE